MKPWKNWPDWIKGTLVIGIFILIFEFYGYYLFDRYFGFESPYFTDFVVVPWLLINMLHLSIISRLIEIIYGEGLENNFVLILTLVIISMLYSIIGGYLYSRIKKRDRKQNSI